MTVLLTGATGFIGRRLLPILADQHDVVAITRRDPPPDLAPLAEWIDVDLSRPIPSGALPRKLTAVVHLAQSERYRDFPAGADEVFAINVAATHALVDAARTADAKRFVLASTGGVYGYNEEHVSETHAVDPLNFYLSSKYAAEVLVANYRELLRTVVLRPFFVYGPGQRGMLIASLVDRVLADDEIVIAGDPGIRVNPTFVDDAAAAFARALTHDASGVFNIAGPESATLTEVVRLIGRLAGREPRITHGPSTASGDLLGDNRRMTDVLGVEPRVGLAEGLSAVIAAAQQASTG